MEAKCRKRTVSFVVMAEGQESEDGDPVSIGSQKEMDIGSQNEISIGSQKEGKKVELGEIAEEPTLEKSPSYARLCELRAMPENTFRLFEEAATLNENDFEDLLNEVEDLNVIHPETNRNLLLHVLHVGRLDLARIVVSQADVTLLKQDCDVTVASLKGKKNALHYVTLLKDVELAKKILSKITDENEKMALLEQETPVKIEGQRPRTLSCCHLAAFLGCRDLVVLYLSHGVLVDAANTQRDTSLFWAVRWNHIDTVVELLSRNADPNKENERGSTALYWAVRYGHTDCARLLIAAGADVNKKRKMGLVSPLILACALGYLPIVKLLVEAGADPNVCITEKERPIHHAAREGYSEIIDYLLDAGARIDEQDNGGNTALLYAARYGHACCLQLLLDRGANHTVKNSLGENLMSLAVASDNSEVIKTVLQTVKTRRVSRGSPSPLLMLAAAGQIDKIESLLSMGLDPATADEDGNTMLHYAAMENQPEVIQKFSAKVNIDAQNDEGNTPLHEACARGHAASILELINCKAATSIRNESGQTALHIAAFCRTIEPEIVKQLLDYITKSHAWESLNVKDLDGNHVLHIAAMFAKPEVMWEFRHIPYKAKDAEGNTALHKAVRRNDPDALTTMLDIYETMKRTADINEQNNRKETVLHLAAKEGFDEQVSRLILLGADISLKDVDGNTVLHSLTELSTMYPPKAKIYLNIFQTIVGHATLWWCMKYQRHYPQGDSSALEAYTRRAALQLLTEIYNNADDNVIGMACRVGASDIVNFILSKKGLMYYQYRDRTLYNVTNMTPLTNNSVSGFCSRDKEMLRLSYVEFLLSLDQKNMACKVLDVQPFQAIEKAYRSVTAWTYFIILILHCLYMCLFSYSAVKLLTKRRIDPSNDTVDSPTIVHYLIVPIEPIIMLLSDLYKLVKNARHGEGTMTYKLHLLFKATTLLPGLTRFVYSIFVLVWIIMYRLRCLNMEFVFSVAVCMGWLYSACFSRGFRPIHYCWRIIQHMFVRDILRFLYFYTFLLLSFTIAFHAMFQLSQKVLDVYPTPFDTALILFNLFDTMEDFYNVDLVNELQTGTTEAYMKIMYVIHVLLATILLMNLLNVMMNDSYSAILQQHRVSWRLESVQLGVNIEKSFPYITRLFSSFKFKKNPPQFLTQHYKRPSLYQVSFSKELSDGSSVAVRSKDIWCISVPQSHVSKELNFVDIETDREVLREMKLKMASMEQRVIYDLHQVKHSLQDICGLLKTLQNFYTK